LIKRLLLVVVFFLGVNSCEFSPTGSNYTEIDRTLPQNLEIRLNDYADTVQVWGSANFSFQFNLEGRGVRRKTIFLDGDSLLDLGNRTEFFFHSSDYSDGSHRLRIDVIADAGTGSLADKIGVEVLLLRREWILLIDNAPPQAVAVTSIEPENGRLRIQWEKNEQFKFQGYNILRSERDVFGPFERVAFITNRHQISVLDSTYIGGKADYRIEVIGASKATAGPVKSFTGPITQFSGFETTASNKIMLRWQRCHFPGNFQKYVISRWQGGWEEAVTLAAVNTTEWVDEQSAFGEAISYRLSVHSSRAFTSVDTAAWIGTKIPAFHRIKYIPSRNSIYLQHGRNLYRLEATTLNVVASTTLENNSTSFVSDYASFDISANGMYAYGSLHDRIFQLDPISLSVIQTHETRNFLNYANAAPSWLHVSNQNQIAFASTIVTKIGPTIHLEDDGVVVIDMSQKKLVAKEKINPSFTIINVSANGNYIATFQNLYRVGNQAFAPIGPIDFFHFNFLNDGDQCVTTQSNSLMIRNSADLSLVANLSDGRDYTAPVIDPASGYLGGYSFSEKAFLIKDLRSGAFIQKQAVLPLSFNDYFYFLLNHTLLSAKGYYLRLSQ
jgi:hypothetical protein